MRSDVGGKFEGGMRKENGQKVERKGEERGKVKKEKRRRKNEKEGKRKNEREGNWKSCERLILR